MFGLARIYNHYRTVLACLFLIAILTATSIWFSITSAKPTTSVAFEYWHLVALVAMFIVVIILDKFCKYSVSEDKFVAALLKNARAFFSLSKLFILLLAVAVTLALLNIYDIQKYIVYAFIVLFYYVVVMVVVSLSVRVIKKELSSNPVIVILLPFFSADVKELSIISFLEENTGITLRSLWSIKYVRKVLPFAIIVSVFLFWISTGVVYVESHQQAVTYRFGTLQAETLSPGLHFTLPYPIDKTEIYNTETINKITIGYKSDENIDNVWTKDHGDSEYKLLLGSGTELVSLNLRIEYKISDLQKYLQNVSSPDLIVEAKAYELTTSRTINTDLHTLLSVDREAFANSFYEELASEVAASNTGIEIVSVIMESIHPPVEVAKVYQDFIGVGIDSERIIIEAQGQATTLKFEAESTRNTILSNANAEYFVKVAEARSEVAEFMASVEAYKGDPDSYVYYKYLDAIGSAYKNANLIILGEGVDGSRIYWNNFQAID